MHRLHYMMALCALGMLSGCVNGTRIQQDYIAIRDECREIAENNYQRYSTNQNPNTPLEVKDQNAILAQIFSDCMKVNGWTVAAPRKKVGIAGPTPPGWKSPPKHYTDSTGPKPANRQPVNPNYQR